MKHFPIVISILIISSFLVGLTGWGGTVHAGSDSQIEANPVPARFIVQFKPGVSPERIQQIYMELGAEAEYSIPQINSHIVNLPEAKAESSNNFSDFIEVAFIEPDYIASVDKTPNDTKFAQQWGLTMIQAPQAWELTQCNEGIIIAILDSGIDSSHSDMASRVIKEKNFSNSLTVKDLYGHGTHVAGIAAATADNIVGIAGMAYNASLMNVKVLGDNGSGSYSRIIQGIIWATDNGANVINMSMGGNVHSKSLEQAIDYAWSKGIVVVAAAGNNRQSDPFYPAYYEKVIAVAATDLDDRLYSFSNYGDWVDVAAPGSAISTLPDDKYGIMNGTSMASPFVAGLAALAFTVAVDEDEDGYLNDEIRSAIESGCESINVSGTGNGRINAYNTISALIQSLPEPKPEPGPAPTPNSDTFGLNSGDNNWNQSAGVLDAMRFRNTSGSGTLSQLELLVDDTTPNGKVRMGVYADNNGKPGNLLLDAGETTVTNGWVSISRLNLPVVENRCYWLAYEMQNGNTIRYQSQQASNSHYWISPNGPLPTSYPVNGFSSNSNPYVMRAMVMAN